MANVRTSFECYCGFKNHVSIKAPTRQTKAWLEHDCLSCSARYDLRFYYDPANTKQLLCYKRLIKMSKDVQEAIEKDAKKSAEINNFKFKQGSVLDGKSANQKSKTRVSES